MKTYIKDAMAISELAYSLENISHDDKKEIEDYTQQEVAAEARYVLSCFYEGGHQNNDALMGDNEDDPYNRAWAMDEVKQLKRYIKKWG